MGNDVTLNSDLSVANNVTVTNDLVVNTDLLVVNASDGRVGIGTDSPASDYKLTVNRSDTSGTFISMNNSDLSHQIEFATPSSNTGIIFNRDSINASRFNMANFNDATEGDRTFRLYFNDDSTNTFVIRKGGNVGIGTSDPQEALDVEGRIITDRILFDASDCTNCYVGSGTPNGQLSTMMVHGSVIAYINDEGGTNRIRFTGGSGWSIVSDQRMKKDIVSAQPVLDKLMNLPIVRYHYVNDDGSNEKHIGILAQEAEPLFPFVISETKEVDEELGFRLKHVTSSQFIYVNMKAIQELNQKIVAQEQDIVMLKQLNEQIQNDNVNMQLQLDTLLLRVEALER